MASKAICLHFHIFKNAGTTIEWILKKNFSKNAFSIDTDDPKGILSYDKVLDFFKKNQNIKALSSHQIRFPLPQLDDVDLIPILFIRHPIDRAFSIYDFQRKRTDADRPGIMKAKELNLNDYIKWSFEIEKFRPMKNFQVIFLSDKDVESAVDENDLRNAIDHMMKCTIIGIVDRFDESMVLAEETLRKYFPNINLAYVKQNVSKGRKGDLAQRIYAAKSSLEESVWEQLLKENELDMKLYQKTNEELDIRLAKINGLKEKLNDFKKRCE